MIRILKSEVVAKAPDDTVYYVEGSCLSTDTKPTDGIANGSVMVEVNTGDVYFYNESGEAWVKQFSFQ